MDHHSTSEPSGPWTTGALHQHLQAEIDALTRRIDERIAFVQLAMQAGAGAMQGKLGDLERSLYERHLAQVKAVEAAFLAEEKAVHLALEAAEKAVTKAEVASEKRFDAVNEFRQQLSDQAATFLPRVEFEAAIGRVTERVEEATELIRATIPRPEYHAAHERLIEQVRDLTSRFNLLEGKGTGLSAAWLYVIGLTSLLGTLFSLYRAISGK